MTDDIAVIANYFPRLVSQYYVFLLITNYATNERTSDQLNVSMNTTIEREDSSAMAVSVTDESAFEELYVFVCGIFEDTFWSCIQDEGRGFNRTLVFYLN